jgi:hypothetical protein
MIDESVSSIEMACTSIVMPHLNEFTFNHLCWNVVLIFKFVKQKSYENIVENSVGIVPFSWV